jgi:hypothetical protein
MCNQANFVAHRLEVDRFHLIHQSYLIIRYASENRNRSAIHNAVAVHNCTLLHSQRNIQVRLVKVQVELASSFAAGNLSISSRFFFFLFLFPPHVTDGTHARLELLNGLLEIPAVRNASVKTICERDGVFRPGPSTPLIRTESGIARPRREPPFHERAERMADRLRLSVTIELKKCDEFNSRASYRMADGT